MELVINKCYGGYGLSRKAMERLIELGDHLAKDYLEKIDTYEKELAEKYNHRMDFDSYSMHCEDRTNPLLIQVVKELGKEANSPYSQLKIVEIPDGVSWHLQEYDGMESVHEDHNVWE